jgi:hypothetical protein
MLPLNMKENKKCDSQENKQPNGTTLSETKAENHVSIIRVFLAFYLPVHSAHNIHKLWAWDTRYERTLQPSVFITA